jgi:hypothetical protein
MTDNTRLIWLNFFHALAIVNVVREAASRSPEVGFHSENSRAKRCAVLTSCPICGSGILKPLSADKTIYLLEGNQPRALGKLRAYSCGSNEHIVIIPAKGSRIVQISGTNGASAAPERPVLNSWKEIAAHMGRGVRTVQRWEQDLGLPVRRPRGKSRSAVIALAADLDEWLHRTPTGNGSNSEEQQLQLESDPICHETTAGTEQNCLPIQYAIKPLPAGAKIVPPRPKQAKGLNGVR